MGEEGLLIVDCRLMIEKSFQSTIINHQLSILPFLPFLPFHPSVS